MLSGRRLLRIFRLPGDEEAWFTRQLRVSRIASPPWKPRTLTSSDLLTVERLSNKIKVLDAELKDHHYTVIDLVGDDEQKLDEEQAVMDDHKDKVAEITEHLQQLRPESKAASSAVHSMGHYHHLLCLTIKLAYLMTAYYTLNNGFTANNASFYKNKLRLLHHTL